MTMQSREPQQQTGPDGQLSLIELPEPVAIDPRFRLSDHTRRLGLLNVARARAILAEAAQRHEHQAA